MKGLNVIELQNNNEYFSQLYTMNMCELTYTYLVPGVRYVICNVICTKELHLVILYSFILRIYIDFNACRHIFIYFVDTEIETG